MMYKIVSLLLDSISHILNLLPVFVIKGFSKIIAFLWYWIFPFRVNLIIKNLKLAYGKEKRFSEIRVLAKENLRHYVYLLLEFIQFRTLSHEDFSRRVSIENLHFLQEAQNENRGIILLTAHLGNFEWMAARASTAHLPLNIIVRPFKNKVLNFLVNEQRQKSGIGLLGPKDSAWKVLKLLSDRKIVGVIFDQRKGSDAVWVQFFGTPALTAKGLAYLIEKSQAIVLPVYAARKEYGHMTVFCEEPVSYKKVGTRSENIYHNTQLYTNVVEQMVRKHPEQWFWIHNRWKQ